MKANLRQYSSYIKLSAVLLVVICLIASTSFVYSAMRKDITIIDKDSEISISTFKHTVRDVLEENNIQLDPFDRANVDLDEMITDGSIIAITRAHMITIETSNVTKFMYTTARNVKTALADAGLYIDELDRVEPSLDTAINDSTTIKVTKVNQEFIEETVDVAFENKVIKNENMDKGLVQVKQKGENGKKQLSIKITYENGVEVDRQVIEEKVLKEAVDGIVEEGTKTTFTNSRGQTFRFTKSLTMTATAYDATFESCGKHPDDPMYGITYSGLKVRPGIVAVDPKVIPLGTYLYVEGYGEALAADIGGAIKGNKIDLYYETPAEVKKFGKKKLKVYVLDKPRYKFK